MFPLFEFAALVGGGCAALIGLISIAASVEDGREKKRRRDAVLGKNVVTVRPAPPVPIKSKQVVPAKAKTSFFEAKPAAQVAAEAFLDVTAKAEFAFPMASKIKTIQKASTKLSSSKEADLVASIDEIVANASSVLNDYSRMKLLVAERRLPLKRIVESCQDVLTKYMEYRDCAMTAGSDLSIVVIDSVVAEFGAANESINALRTDEQKNALNKLQVELHVLRDVTRR